MKKIDEIRLMLKNGLEPDYQGWGWGSLNRMCKNRLPDSPLCVYCTCKWCSFEGQLINEVECVDFVSDTDIELFPA